MTDLKLFIEEMRATSSSTEKSAIIARSSTFIHEVLEATYNPYKQYYTTSKTCLKNSELVAYGNTTPLLSLLKMLNTREVTGHDAIKLVNRFAQSNIDWDLIYKIIDKDLDIRIGAKGINKGVPGLIPTFSVALAKEYEDGKCEWKDGWFASRKLDGVRCLARVNEEGKCTLFSRTGKEFTTLDKVKEAIEATGVTSITFDGEICLVDKDGNEDFQGVMKQLRRKDHQIQNPAYIIFDVLDNIDFDNAKGNIPLKTRLQKIRSWLALTGNNNSNILRYTEQVKIEDNNHFELWSEMSNQNGWEGVMLRKNVGYEGKRTKNLVKVKKFFDNEYKVVGFDIDNHEVVRDGKSVTMQMLSQVYIEHKGYKVKVGSGFTQEQRLKYMDGSIMGKTICVQYFSETKNDKGGISLRFPTLKHIYDGKRDM
jgi:DNA ligase-1